GTSPTARDRTHVPGPKIAKSHCRAAEPPSRGGSAVSVFSGPRRYRGGPSTMYPCCGNSEQASLWSWPYTQSTFGRVGKGAVRHTLDRERGTHVLFSPGRRSAGETGVTGNMATSRSTLGSLYDSLKAGKITRRQFLHRATATGIGASAALFLANSAVIAAAG